MAVRRPPRRRLGLLAAAVDLRDGVRRGTTGWEKNVKEKETCERERERERER